jgi:zinc and cadmium transporter
VSAALVTVLFCVVIVAASLFGGWLPTRVRLSHSRMQLIISFVGGFMLGVALFHMLPHATAYTKSLDTAVLWMVGGLLGMFFLIRLFHFHEHEPVADHAHKKHNWAGMAAGLIIHSVLDGIAVGAAVLAESGEAVMVAGLGTGLAVLLHKPLDAFSVTSLMRVTHAPIGRMRLANVILALAVPVGALLFFFGAGEPGPAVGCALALSAGVFVCIALSDLLPEVHFHSHDRLKLSVALLLGVVLAYGIGFLEGDAHHGHDHGHGHHGHDHDH